MEQQGMTDVQFKAFIRLILHILKNEKKKKAIAILKKLIAD